MNHTLFFLLLGACDAIRAVVVDNYPQSYTPEVPASPAEQSAPSSRHSWPEGVPRYSGADSTRERVSIHLEPVLTGVAQPTEMVFFPQSNHEGFLLEKAGTLKRFNLTSGALIDVVSIEVPTESEQGLLGVALHPDFSDTGRFFLHTSSKQDGDKSGVISEWSYRNGQAVRTRTVFSIDQPYANHNGGSITFGPDGMLYIGLGDGGWRGDPHDHGQNGATLLGSILRIDPDEETAGKPYGIPDDNPWAADPTVAPEAWAIGLRNPWKFSFAPDGRMIAADVGQNAWEEVNLVQAKDNLGWNTREAAHCFPPENKCTTTGLVDPVYEYPHSEGQSITGGYVASNASIPEIENHYVFADFVSGRLWAIPLPAESGGPMVTARTLGQWPFLPSTFGQSADGTLYVVGFGEGTVYRFEPG